MSIKIIQERLNEYAPQTELEQENALKEIAQEIVLHALSRAGFFKVAAFQGGTCLRVLYQLNRFSEDLDFALHQPNHKFLWTPYLNSLQTELEAYGFIFTVEEKDQGRAVKDLWLKEDSLGSILKLTHRTKKIKIKLEVDTNPPMGAGFEQKYIDFPVTTPVVCHDLASLFAGKSHALLCRKVSKGRDWFDFSWYVGRRATINFVLLSDALRQIGSWQGKKIAIDNQWYYENLKAKIESTDWQQQRKDVERFLKRDDRDLLNHWSRGYFLDRLNDLIPRYSVRVSRQVKGKEPSSYFHDNATYFGKEQAIAVGKQVFATEAGVIMVEVFQAGVARPIAYFD